MKEIPTIRSGSFERIFGFVTFIGKNPVHRVVYLEGMHRNGGILLDIRRNLFREDVVLNYMYN